MLLECQAESGKDLLDHGDIGIRDTLGRATGPRAVDAVDLAEAAVLVERSQQDEIVAQALLAEIVVDGEGGLRVLFIQALAQLPFAAAFQIVKGAFRPDLLGLFDVGPVVGLLKQLLFRRPDQAMAEQDGVQGIEADGGAIDRHAKRAQALAECAEQLRLRGALQRHLDQSPGQCGRRLRRVRRVALVSRPCVHNCLV